MMLWIGWRKEKFGTLGIMCLAFYTKRLWGFLLKGGKEILGVVCVCVRGGGGGEAERS